MNQSFTTRLFSTCCIVMLLLGGPVLKAQTTCDAHFAHYTLSNPDSLHFYPASTAGVSSYSWNFGDGGTSSYIYPWHDFAGPGVYNVCLTVADTNGSTCTWCDTVQIGTVATCNASFSHYILNNPDSLHFYPTGSSGTAYYWNFGDGTTSPLQYPWHYYTSPGTYQVCLTVADTSGVTCSKCDTVTVGSPSACSAAFSHYSLNNPDSLHFYATATSGIASWYWNFGDGTTSTLQYPWHYFATAGTYYVCLTVVDSNGQTCTSCDNVHVGPVATCSAAITYYSINGPDSIRFHGPTTGVLTYSWTFGDGGTASVSNPLHIFANSGTFYVCLSVVDSNGQTCSSCDTVTVAPATTCNAGYGHYELNGDSIHFYPTVTTNTSYYWSFGDGTYSTKLDPFHTYASSGTYNACLTVVDTAGQTCTWCDTVTFVGPNASTCSAAFTYYSINGPDSIRFHGPATGVASYSWNFGDGGTATGYNPLHIFASSGSYYVCLSVVDSNGQTCSTCDTVNIGTISATCNAQFSFYTLTNPDSLHFYPTGTPASAYYWSFGDGTTSTLQYPWHHFSGPGAYHVCLTIEDTTGAQCSWCDTVHVAGTSTTCNAAFSHYNLTSNVDSFHFYPTGPHALSYYWTFGDGGTSTNMDPWHFYSNPGTYTACLTVVDSNGSTCTSCDTVTVAPSNICSAGFSYYTLHNPDSLHFYPTGAPAVSYYWSFGDGTTSTAQYPWHYYTHSGTYYVCLTVVADTAGLTCTSCDTVQVGSAPACSAAFTDYHLTGAGADSVHFYPTGIHGVAYYWNFGDGDTSSNFDPWHFYATAGTYYACLTVVDSAGTTCTSCDTVQAGNTAVCSALFSHYSPTSNADSVHFYPLASNGTAYYWSFGDSGTSTQEYPWYYYSHYGTYYVCLTVVDTSGATCTSCDTVVVGHSNFQVLSSHHSSGSNPDSVEFIPIGSDAVAWYWNFGDGSYTSQTSPWHHYGATGVYYVVLTAADSAGAVSVSYDTVNTGAAAIVNVPANGVEVKVYPNPANDAATVQVKNIPANTAFRLMDLSGQVIYTQFNLVEGNFVLSTKHLSSGIYFYSLTAGNETMAEGKIAVVH